jgi:hypothetical protein
LIDGNADTITRTKTVVEFPKTVALAHRELIVRRGFPCIFPNSSLTRQLTAVVQLCTLVASFR